MLSLTNKSGPGRFEYLARKRDILWQQVHLVELDLLLQGERLPLRRPLPPAHYYAFVARWDRRPDCEVYPWTLSQRLPTIRIPLRSPDPDVTIDLQGVFDTAFERGRYERSVDYGRAAELPLAVATRDWASEQVKARES